MSTTTNTSPDAKLIQDLQAFPYCRKTLSLPYTVLRYFIDDYAIFYTDLGYHFRRTGQENREHFFYDVFEDINNLTHGGELPDSVKSRITGLEEMDKELKPFNLFSMSYDEGTNEYLLFYEPTEVYITICAQDIPFISEATAEHLKSLELNKPSNPYMIYLENDGGIVK